jgi:dTDP-glucose pyrophosphorylase|tara:strand:- start:17 stop:754 length:738 start_codon:yes stop_codon:yes gene_type:complete
VKNSNKRQINIMPMAGDGLRLKGVGYNLPKPLIDINGEPMFIRSAKCMPDADLWIFITKKKFVDENKIDQIIKKNFKNYEIITVEETTEGQASSCYLAKKFLKSEDSIFINSCDSFIEFNFDEYNLKKNNFDVLVFSTECKDVHKKKPNSYGWIKKYDSGLIDLSCKKPFHSSLKNERPIVGSFAFNKSIYFTNSLESLFKSKNKINNEYYLDMSIKECINLGYKVEELKVNKYVDWGDKEELKF